MLKKTSISRQPLRSFALAAFLALVAASSAHATPTSDHATPTSAQASPSTTQAAPSTTQGSPKLFIDSTHAAKFFAANEAKWNATVDEARMIRVMAALAAAQTLSADDATWLKGARSPWKAMRFSYQGFDVHHVTPDPLETCTIDIGKINDLILHHEHTSLVSNAKKFGTLLATHPVVKIQADFKSFSATDTASFNTWANSGLDLLDQWGAKPTMTVMQFHSMRKFIGAISLVLSSVCADQGTAVDPALSAAAKTAAQLNSLMGDEHDDYMGQAAAGQINTHTSIVTVQPDTLKQVLAFSASVRNLLKG
jgi:hypothetical protein